MYRDKFENHLFQIARKHCLLKIKAFLIYQKEYLSLRFSIKCHISSKSTPARAIFVAIELVTVVEKLASSPSAAANSFNVFKVLGAESAKFAIAVSVKQLSQLL
ncbi:MAG: hypothetical protein CM15mV93_020 [Caudoviricetes sp.]|nr:MAG: hypothetical protein CM15mV93_020 [Caudoviricetes sp.]